MTKLTQAILDAIEDAKTNPNSKQKIENGKSENKCFYVLYCENHFNLLWGKEEVVRLSDTYYTSLIVKMFETFIKF